MNKKISSYILFLSFLILPLNNITLVSATAGDSIQNAIPISLETVSGTFPGPDPYGFTWYNLTASSEGMYQFNLTQSNHSGSFTVIFSDGSQSGTNYPYIVKRYLTPGIYSFSIGSTVSGDFNFTVSFTPPQPGDRPENPISITTGTTSGTMVGPGFLGEIYYNFTAINKAIYNFSVDSPIFIDMTITTFDNFYIDEVANTEGPLVFTLVDLDAGNYLIMLRPVYKSTGNYNLTITENPPTPGESYTNPINLGSLNATIFASSPGPGVHCSTWYEFSITSQKRIDFNITPDLYTYPDMYVYTSTLNEVSNIYHDSFVALLNQGDYYIKIEPFYYSDSRAFFNYNLTVNTTSMIPGEFKANAIPINVNTTISGAIPPSTANNQIFYKLTSSGDMYYVNFTGEPAKGLLYAVYDQSNNQVGGTNKYYLSAGDYYIKIYTTSSIGSYNLTVNILPPKEGDSEKNAISVYIGTIQGSFPGPSVVGGTYYRFDVTTPNEFYFESKANVNSSYYLFLYNTTTLIGATVNTTVLDMNLTIGIYYLYTYTTQNGQYNISISKKNTVPGDALTNAIIVDSTTLTGTLPGNGLGGSIWYNFSIANQSKQSIKVSSNPSVQYKVSLFDQFGSIINTSISQNGNVDLTGALETGQYSLTLVPIAGLGDYSIEFLTGYVIISSNPSSTTSSNLITGSSIVNTTTSSSENPTSPFLDLLTLFLTLVLFTARRINQNRKK